jgi:predicted alpha/beta-hydrolase family hydrolase
MQRWAALLGAIGDVQTFDYAYMVEGRGRPDIMPKLLAAHRAALQRARESHQGPAILIGKSMGSRIGCHLALEEDVAAVMCLGYPLCGAGDRAKLRDQVLIALRTPILFVQGTRDLLCPLDLLQSVRSKMTAPNELHVVEAGDHSLLVTRTQLKASGETQEDVDHRVLAAIEKFLTKHARAN